MENNEKKNHSLIDLMDASMSKIREMVDSNTIIGEPIQTPDGVTLIPVSRLSFGFGCGGGDYGKQTPAMFGGASTAGVKVYSYSYTVISCRVAMYKVFHYNFLFVAFVRKSANEYTIAMCTLFFCYFYDP